MNDKSRGERIVERLVQMRSSSPEIEASAVVSVDGLIVASDLPRTTEEDRVAAMSAAMLSLGERISRELGRGELDQVYVRGGQGYVLLVAAGQDAVLTVLTRREAKLGLVLLDTRRCAADIAKLVE